MKFDMWTVLLIVDLIAIAIALVMVTRCLLLEFRDIIGKIAKRYVPRFYYYDYDYDYDYREKL